MVNPGKIWKKTRTVLAWAGNQFKIKGGGWYQLKVLSDFFVSLLQCDLPVQCTKDSEMEVILLHCSLLLCIYTQLTIKGSQEDNLV